MKVILRGGEGRTRGFGWRVCSSGASLPASLCLAAQPAATERRSSVVPRGGRPGGEAGTTSARRTPAGGQPEMAPLEWRRRRIGGSTGEQELPLRSGGCRPFLPPLILLPDSVQPTPSGSAYSFLSSVDFDAYLPCRPAHTARLERYRPFSPSFPLSTTRKRTLQPAPSPSFSDPAPVVHALQ